MRVTLAVARVGAIVLIAIGGAVWMSSSIELASIYWLIAIGLAASVSLLSVLGRRAGAPLEIASVTLLTGLAPLVVSATPEWALYPLAAAAAFWASQRLGTAAQEHAAVNGGLIRPTPDSAPRPGRLARRARIMAAVNVPMRLVLDLPFNTPLSKALMLLSFTGRRTGKRYRQPVSYAQDGDTLLTPGGGRWKLNLRADEPVQVRLRGRSVQLRPELVTDVNEVARLVGRLIALNPRAAGFMPFIGPGGEIERTKVEAAINYGFAIVRWHFFESEEPRSRTALLEEPTQDRRS
jgi:hypothetical protein